MRTFLCSVIDFKTNTKTTKIIECKNKNELSKSLKTENLILLNSQEIINKRPKPRVLIDFYFNLSLLLSSGISIEKALEAMEDKDTQIIVKNAKTALNLGLSFATGLEGMISKKDIATIKIGQESGNLDKVLRKLSASLQNATTQKNKVINLLIYPSVTFASSLVALFFVCSEVLPQFKSLFQGNDLPFITELLLFISSFLNYENLIFIGVLALILGLCSYFVFRNFAAYFSALALRLPVIGRLIYLNNMRTFCDCLASTLNSGLNITEAMKLSIETLENKTLKSRALQALLSITQGESLHRAFSIAKLADKRAISLLQVSEISGKLDSCLEALSLYFDENYNSEISTLTKLVEPISSLFLGLVVLLLALGIFMPMWSAGNFN